MKISIVTISFNQVRFLSHAIESVLSQQGVDLEYIVVDPGSTDGSRDVLQHYRPWIQHLVLTPDAGPADGLNNGFRLASGDILGYLNADDKINSGTLKDVVDRFTEHRDVDVFAGHGEVIDESDRIIHRLFSRRLSVEAYLDGDANLVQPSTFFRAQWFRQVGGFNPHNRVSWDGELALDICAAGANVRIVPAFWSQFRFYSGSISSQGDEYSRRLAQEYERLCDKYHHRRPSSGRGRLNWAIRWLAEPRTLGLRMLDGIRSPRRVL